MIFFQCECFYSRWSHVLENEPVMIFISCVLICIIVAIIEEKDLSIVGRVLVTVMAGVTLYEKLNEGKRKQIVSFTAWSMVNNPQLDACQLLRLVQPYISLEILALYYIIFIVCPVSVLHILTLILFVL